MARANQLRGDGRISRDAPASDRPVSGYGSRLEAFIRSAIAPFSKSKEDPTLLRSTASKYLLEGIAAGLAVSHLIEALRDILLRVGFQESEIKNTQDYAREVTREVAHTVVVNWEGAQPSSKEIIVLRRLVPDLGGLPMVECKRRLKQKSLFELGQYPHRLAAEQAQANAQAQGLKAIVRAGE